MTPISGAYTELPAEVVAIIEKVFEDQLILENLLDDRHDLTGNSVYG